MGSGWDDDDFELTEEDLKPLLFGNEDVPSVPAPQPTLVQMPQGGEMQSLSEQMQGQEWDWRQPRQCVICGKEFMPRNRRHWCCSSNCWYKLRYRRRELHHKSMVKTCKWCGKKMLGGTDGWAWGLNFCSPSCAGKWSRAKRIREGTWTDFRTNPERAREQGLKHVWIMRAARKQEQKKKEQEEHNHGQSAEAQGAVRGTD